MNEENFVIFKNPHLRYRKEDFGGVVKLQLKTLIINKKQYELINGIKKILVYNLLNDSDKRIVEKLINENILLKVDVDRARELGFVEKI
jgi:hypothetical protein